MPTEPRRICYHPGCHSLAIPGKSRCEKHESVKHVGTSRNRSGDPFYSSKSWLRLKRQKLDQNRLCECDDCVRDNRITPADTVDHIRPRRLFPELQLELGNLRSMAKRHHDRHTGRTKHLTKREDFPPWIPPQEPDAASFGYC